MRRTKNVSCNLIAMLLVLTPSMLVLLQRLWRTRSAQQNACDQLKDASSLGQLK